MKPIYLDHNASTPLLPEVIDAMMPYLKSGFGNPSSSHWYGQQSKKAIEKARNQIALLLNCSPEEIIFTSGGSESNNLAIKGIADQYTKGHIITSSIEHPAVLEVCHYLEKRAFNVTYLPVDEYGIVNPESVKNAIRSDTILITIMLANNEVGTIEPIREIVKIAGENGITTHTDAAQAVGKIHVDVKELGADLLSVAGHKMNAPKGIGALYIKTGTNLSPIIHGAGHERGLRAGTENVLEIVGLGAAAEAFQKNEEKIIENQKELRNQFWNKLKQQIPDIQLNGHPDKTLPNTLNIYFPGTDSNTLLAELPDIAASAGAACHTDSVDPSHVLKAMGFSNGRALGSIRFSTGRTTTPEDISNAVIKISKVVKQLTKTDEIEKIHFDASQIQLTQFTHGLGCACKIRPQNLEKILNKIKPLCPPEVLVGFESSDDAAVYHLNNEIALVSTVDFFTPIVDDPYDFGRIAAANSLSDIYAMGARPLFALNVVAFPEKRLPIKVLENILKGAQTIADESNTPIIGGHTIEDNEPKFGLAVTGTVHPDKILRNSGAIEGDVLILTKPIGLGVLTTALKRGLLDDKTKKNIIDIMCTLNAKAAEIITNLPVHACTDITGFGLLGHLYEMTSSSKVRATIYASKVPIIQNTYEMVQMNIIPGGTQSNMNYLKPHVKWSTKVSFSKKVILCDAQTSGGLIISLPEKYSKKLIYNFHNEGILNAEIIGTIEKGSDGKINVVP
ncbi:MAG: selenide, water dikinase SelD [Candidatus Neomarinimicrobiota bacterium]|nr:MAG: selenide, water dikinase SelD [Candidatus Neomarinimicrobiota bacterium]